MSDKETSISSKTYPLGGDMYDYDVHLKSSEHINKYFKLSPVVDFCCRLKAKRWPTRLLDLGSGIGFESAVLIDSLPNTEIFSLDISTEGSRRGKMIFGLDQIQADVECLPFGKKSFDAVHCKDVLVHVPDKSVFIRGISRILKRGGILLLVSAKKAWDENIQFEWTPDQVIAAAKRQGLELISLDIKNLRTDDWYDKPKDRVFLMFRKK